VPFCVLVITIALFAVSYVVQDDEIHFTCRAELPLGSVLRVTGSASWALTSLNSPQDPMNAHHVAQERSADAFPILLPWKI
jgi:hypothetical protein